MNGLMAKNKVNIEQVKAVRCPEGTKSWKPISHFDLIERAKEAADKVGLKIGNEEYGLSKENNTQMFGVIEILNHDHFNNEIRLMMGLRNSIDKSLSAGICWGSKVFVCDNLCFSAYDSELGSSLITRKHTRFIENDLPLRLDEGMKKFEFAKEYHEKFFNNLKNSYVSMYDVHDVLVKAAIEGAIPNKDIPKVREEYLFHLHKPETPEQEAKWHESFSEPNAFSLFNAFTETAKPYQAKNSLVSADRTIKLTKLFQKEFLMN